MTRLHDLYELQGQSPWLDNIQRGWISSGELQRWVDRGVRGLTSNPSIFQKAIAGSTSYDRQFRSVIASGLDITSAYWRLVTSDITAALSILAPVHESSGGLDGHVSVEIDPGLARDSARSEQAARQLDQQLAAPNLYVKIPATAEGLGPIERLTAEKRSINVTLIFGLDRYAEVIESYLSGLEAAAGDLSGVSSVASFFVSRVDTEIDRRLEAIGSYAALGLRGSAAIANAKLAFELQRRHFSGPRWDALAARGARPQRVLWASTSTKNPAYPDTLYVDELIGAGTVNTLPDTTLVAFEDHGTVAATLAKGLEQAREIPQRLREVGVDFEDVTRQLEEEGVSAFLKSFDELLETLTRKADQL